jgi:hypothetical protein
VHFKPLLRNWFSLLILIAFALFMLLNPLPHNSWQQKVFVIFLWAFGLGLTALSYWIRTPERKIEREEREEREDRLAALKVEKGENEARRPAFVFGKIYAIVNGLGIVQTLQDYVKIINENLANLSARTFSSILEVAPIQTLRLFGFFMTQIPFLHGAVLALSSDTSEFRTDPSRNQYLPFLIFVALLVHAALFYFVGTNLLNLPLFTFFLWILFTFNSVWLSVLRILIPRELVIREWIQLNSITAAFIFAYFFYPYFIDSSYTMTDEFSSNIVLLVILTSRTILDYGFGWTNFYKQVY